MIESFFLSFLTFRRFSFPSFSTPDPPSLPPPRIQAPHSLTPACPSLPPPLVPRLPVGSPSIQSSDPRGRCFFFLGCTPRIHSFSLFPFQFSSLGSLGWGYNFPSPPPSSELHFSQFIRFLGFLPFPPLFHSFYFGREPLIRQVRFFFPPSARGFPPPFVVVSPIHVCEKKICRRWTISSTLESRSVAFLRVFPYCYSYLVLPSPQSSPPIPPYSLVAFLILNSPAVFPFVLSLLPRLPLLRPPPILFYSQTGGEAGNPTT